MNHYDFWGMVNTIFISVSVYGIYCQLCTIWQNKNKTPHNDKTSGINVLSLNQFTVSFFAYLSFFIYGYCIEPFNHYIVWPRLIASTFVALILFEIWRARSDKNSFVTLFFCFLSLLTAILVLIFFRIELVDETRVIATSMILVISLLIAQGYGHQIYKIIKAKDTGVIDIRMSLFILLMDISTIMFVFSMGVNVAWPLFVLAVTSAITKVIMLYLFYWVKSAPSQTASITKAKSET